MALLAGRPPASRSVKVAHFGAAGAFSHMAAHEAFGTGAEYIARSTIGGVFDAVSGSKTDFGVVPVENSTEGGVTATMDGLLETDTLIQRELALQVVQCLIARDPSPARIRRVYSHPQALAQCRGWLATHLPHAELLAATSTTEAAEKVTREVDSAAIASRMAAELYGLELVRESIQDLADNVTRFLVLGRGPVPPSGYDKTSIAFATTHTRGALCQILGILADADLNLTRIESRPGREQPWEYVFFVDIEGHSDEPALARALDLARARCIMLKLLGSYPRAARSVLDTAPYSGS